MPIFSNPNNASQSSSWSWITWFALNNQSKQRHVASIVHYPIKTPPRALYCALPNQTRPTFFYCAFCCTGKKKLKSNVFYNSSPYGTRVNMQVIRCRSLSNKGLEVSPCSSHVISNLVFPFETKENVCMTTELDSRRISWGHQHGRR